jgi:hypothetical protein
LKFKLILIFPILLLVGCFGPDEKEVPFVKGVKSSTAYGYKFITIDNKDGIPIECIKYGWGRQAGLSCDWEKYHNQKPGAFL